MSLVGARVRSFSESLGVLLGVQQRFGEVHALILLDADSRVVDGFAFTDLHRASDAAVEIGIAVGTANNVVRRALLLSGGLGSVVPIEWADLERWRGYVTAFAAIGVDLVDWLASDGEHIRSYAITADAGSAWVSS
ncbi:MAG: hypothetical protein ACRD0A_01310 [Acidimicrobiales bacterium]